MKGTLIFLLLCLVLLPGCYVHTQMEGEGGRVPGDFPAGALVVAVRDRVGLTEAQVADLEQDAVQALTRRGIRSVGLNEATGGPAPGDPKDLLKRRDYPALLEITVTSWGSKIEILSTAAGPSVGTLQTGPDTSFYKPGSIEEAEYRGPTTTYKEVGITASLLDLQGDRTLWSAEIVARPAVIGRSFLYHNFNRGLQYEDLARHCFTRLAAEFPRPQAARSD
jgi:hypothetical protein